MPHAAKLLARLNAKTTKFNVGQGGGVPDLTNEMIAGAIAFVPAGLGRELMCFVWWPGGAVLTERQLDEMLMTAHMTEWVRREDEYQTARTRLAVHAHTSRLRSATKSFETADRERWPAIIRNGRHDCMEPVATYSALREAVLTELRLGDYCVPCDGLGVVGAEDGEPTACANCDGTGHRQCSDRWRAKACGIHLSAYQKNWARVYAWTLAHCRTIMGEAEGEFLRAVA